MRWLSSLADAVRNLALACFYKPLGISRYAVTFNNHRQEDGAINAIVKLLATAQSTLNIASGELNHRLYNDRRILETFRKLAKNEVRIEIVYSHEVDPETTGPFKLEEEGYLKTYKLPNEMSPHFMVVDRAKVLDEVRHTHSIGAPEPHKRLFYIIPNSPLLAKNLEREFALRKRQALNAHKTQHS